MSRSYSELKKLYTLLERWEYLRLFGSVGEKTFGFDRYLNQILYRSKEWLRARDKVIIRDNGCDLGIPGFDLRDRIVIHHMNPISIEEIESNDKTIYDEEFLICCSHNTHLAIHYANFSLLPKIPKERSHGDTSPWLK